jgi:hypothetical protein
MAMKHYILAYPELPPETTAPQRRILIDNFEEKAKGIELPLEAGSLLPSGPVWLLKRENAEPALERLFALATYCEVTLRLKYLTED